MTHITNATSAGAALPTPAGDQDLRILRRVSALSDFPLAERATGTVRRVAIVDTETTGTDVIHDEIIDIAVVVIEVDEVGEIVGIVSAGQALRDPGMPIPPHISRLTGITDADVCGKAIDLDRLERLLAGVEVRIAHSAAFDIGFIENLMPGLAGEAWACSMRDFDWAAVGFDGAKLGYLLTQIGRFNTAHRAMADVVTLLHLLAHRLPHGGTVIGEPARQRRTSDRPLRGARRPVRPAHPAQKPRPSLGRAQPRLVDRARPGRLCRGGALVPRTSHRTDRCRG